MPDRPERQPDSATLHSVAPAVRSFELGPFATNCYIVSIPGAPACWIIDAGMDPAALIKGCKANGLLPEKIILTHAHLDHIAGLDEIRRAFPGVSVYIHEAEAAFLEDPMLNLSGAYGFPISIKPADRFLKGGEVLELSGTQWRVLYTPGHSPGGITLWCEEAGVAFVGDTLFNGSIGRSDFPTSDERLLHQSIREGLYALPESTRVLPGHGPETTIGVEKRTNPFVRS